MLSDVVADQIRRERRRLGINREQLAERCARLGAPKLTTATITNIETGRPSKDGVRRREISVDELVVLARALGVPPVLLVLPLGQVDSTEALPGDVQPTWPLVRWFIGAERYPDAGHEEYEAHEQASAPLTLYADHEKGVKAWEQAQWWERMAHRQRDNATEDVDRERTTAAAKEAAVAAGSAKRWLYETRRTMRQLGLLLPALPDGIGDVDTEPLELAIREHYERQEGGEK